MVESSTTGVLENLRDFLSTDVRRKLFFHYVFSKTSPSDLAESTNTPLSTVDMVTNSLRLMELLERVKGKKKNENYYEINMELWIMENLRALGLDFIKEEQQKDMLKILGDRQFLALSYILTNPVFAMKLYEDPLKMGEDLIVYKIMSLFKRGSLASDLPSYILMCFLIFPSFKQLKDSIVSEEGLDRTIKLINKEISSHPFLTGVFKEIKEETLKDYNGKRAKLSVMMERLIEQDLQVLSTKKAEKAVEAEEPKEAEKVEEVKEEKPKEEEKTEEDKAEKTEEEGGKEAEKPKKTKKPTKRKKKEEKVEKPEETVEESKEELPKQAEEKEPKKESDKE